MVSTRDEHRMIPAGPRAMLPWILEALAKGPMTRDELHIAVDEIARTKRLFVDDVRSLGKALAILNKDNHVSNIQKGWWALAGGDFPSAALGPRPVVLNGSNVSVNREIGKGEQVVFLLYISTNGLKHRPNEVTTLFVGTAGPELVSNTDIDVPQNSNPQIALAIYCDNASALAQVIAIGAGATIHPAKGRKPVATVNTTPYSIEVFYRSWLKAVDHLRKAQHQSNECTE